MAILADMRVRCFFLMEHHVTGKPLNAVKDKCVVLVTNISFLILSLLSNSGIVIVRRVSEMVCNSL